MSAPRLYVSVPLTVGDCIELPENAFRHAVQVLKLKTGAEIVLFNGKGGEYRAILQQVASRSAMARVAGFVAREAESPLSVNLVQSVAKGERMDYSLQKAVELGAQAIQPVFSERCVVQLNQQRIGKRLRHWQGVVISACEQCGRNRLPQLHTPLPLAVWFERHNADKIIGVVLDPLADQGLKALSLSGDAITLLVGPEGGLSAAEIAQAEDAGLSRVRLGPRVLRTETAGVAALAAMQTLWGDF